VGWEAGSKDGDGDYWGWMMLYSLCVYVAGRVENTSPDAFWGKAIKGREGGSKGGRILNHIGT
jgi:hypothetical protein